jgi:hypothetical protein
MRRLTATVVALSLAVPMFGVVAGPGPAAAQPSPTAPADGGEDGEDGEGPEVPEAVPGEEVCAVADPRLVEVSGMVATGDGYLVVNDGTEFADREGIFVLDQDCQVIEQIGYPSQPRDPEELALDHDANVLWVGDTGDNVAAGLSEGEARPSVALWRVDLGGDRTPVISRFTYPGGEAYDAEALLLDGDGVPIIVTKSVGTAELFKPAEEPRPSAGPDDTQELEAVGEFSPVDTGTEHSLGVAARQAVTGGARTPDGSRVVLRTYTDAYEFDVTDGDVVGAVVDGEPRITVLPDEPLGEAISYTPDGAQFLTVSEVPPDSGFTPVMLSYTPSEPAPEEPEQPAEPAAGSGGGGGGLLDSVQDIINLIAVVGVVGVLLVAAGIFGIVRARRRGRGGDGPGGGPGGDGDGDGPATGRARLSEEQAAGQAGVYTSQAARHPGAGEYHGAEYGGNPAGGEYRGTEYGGTEYGGQPYQPDGYGEQPYQPGDGYGGEYGGAEYPRAGYGGAEYGGQQPYQPGDGYGGQPGYQPNGGYAGGGYQEQQPYDQEWPNGYDQHPPQPAPQGYPAAGPGYPADAGYPPEPGYPAGPGGPAVPAVERAGEVGGGAYPGGTYQSGAPERRDGYSDDPDYPYEFRQQPGRW